MLNKVISTIIDRPLDWFFQTYLKDHYDEQRKILSDFDPTLVPSIDHLIQTNLPPDTITTYPPESTSKWLEILNSVDLSKFIQHILVIYLQLDLKLILSDSHDKMGKTLAKDKRETIVLLAGQLNRIPYSLDFPNSVVSLASGLWALDNGNTDLTVQALSYPSLNLNTYFECPQMLLKIIIETLTRRGQARMALHLSKIFGYENFNEKYDRLYSSLLVSTGQIIEALKYVRLFSDEKNFMEIMQHFFKISLQLSALNAVKRMKLSIEEERAFNLVADNQQSPNTPTRRKSSKTTSFQSEPRPKAVQMVQRVPSFNDSPARNTRLARKRKSNK